MKNKVHIFRSFFLFVVALSPQLVKPDSTPAPCANCSGTWTDNYGYTWTLDTHADNSVTGSFNSNGVDGCPTTVRQVSGTFNRSDATFQISADNPTPAAGTACFINGVVIAASVRYGGSITNGGCDTGQGNWANDTNSGQFTWSKQCDTPDSETTYDSGYWADSGLNGLTTDGTQHLWEAQLNADRDFSGRFVEESTGTAGVDNCHYAGSPFDALDHVSGGTWFVNSPGFFYNGWGYDANGYAAAAVTHYRSVNRAPCGYQVYQNMSIYCNTNGQTPKLYQSNISLNGSIDATSVTVTRAGVTAYRQWP